jgi:uncharacterized protein HemY
LALQLSQSHVNNPAYLNELAWNSAKAPGRNQDNYALALRQGEAAVRWEPNNGLILNTLGVAQYRMGLFAEAASTLSQSNNLNKQSQPTDWAFLAMAQHRLGKKDETEAAMKQLRELMKKPEWAQNPEAQAFLKEAEAVLKEPAGK